MEYRKLAPGDIPALKHLLRAAIEQTKYSPDTSRGVGAVIYDSSLKALAADHNRLPLGIQAFDYRLSKEDTGKYMWLVHAERACIAKCFREGTLGGAFGMVVTIHPCEVCAQSIIEYGFKQLVTRLPRRPTGELAKWHRQYQVAREMLEESRVEVFYYRYEIDRNIRRKERAPRLKPPLPLFDKSAGSEKIVSLRKKP